MGNHGMDNRMLTGELVANLSTLGTHVVHIANPTGSGFRAGIRVSFMISHNKPWDSLLMARNTGTPKTAAQTARELAPLEHDGEAKICFIDGPKESYYRIKEITCDNTFHAVIITPGELISLSRKT